MSDASAQRAARTERQPETDRMTNDPHREEPIRALTVAQQLWLGRLTGLMTWIGPLLDTARGGKLRDG